MRKALVPTTALAFAAFVVGCNDDDEDIVRPPSTAAQIRFVNATRDVASIEILNGSRPIIGAIALRAATSCIAVPATTRSIVIRAARGSLDFGTFTFSPGLVAGRRFTVIALGPSTAPQFVEIPDDLRPVLGTGSARLRVINATTSPNAFDVFVTPPGAVLGMADVTSLASRGSTAFVDTPSVLTEVRVTNTGSTDVLIDVRSLSLKSGELQTVILVDDRSAATGFSFVAMGAGCGIGS